MIKTKPHKASTKSEIPVSGLSIVNMFTERTASLLDIDKIFSETIDFLKNTFETNDVWIYSYLIKNQKLQYQYHEFGNEGEIDKAELTTLPLSADIVRSAVTQSEVLCVRTNKENKAFVSSEEPLLINLAIPFFYQQKILGCIHMQCREGLIAFEDFEIIGSLMSRHMGLICSKPIEQVYLDEFKSRIRKLINVKINELQEALDKADKYNQSLKDFSYIVSHDLREPLRTINSYIKLLNRRYHDRFDEDAQDFMHFVTDGVARMDALIKDLLAFSRIEHSVYKFEEVEIERILISVKNNLRLKIEETSAEIDLIHPVNFKGSRSHLNILFQNLIDNAIKFRDPSRHPKVQIETKELENFWQFSIIDNGIGMNLEHKNHERIFKIFQRLHGVGSKIPGTGIGLAICKHIVDAHGGKIWVNSIPGKGSTFHFTISKHLIVD